MKVTKSYIKRIIKEELNLVLSEMSKLGFEDPATQIISDQFARALNNNAASFASHEEMAMEAQNALGNALQIMQRHPRFKGSSLNETFENRATEILFQQFSKAITNNIESFASHEELETAANNALGNALQMMQRHPQFRK